MQLTIGNVFSSIEYPESERDNLGALLQKNLTVEVPGAKYLWAYKSGEWDGRVRLFEQEDQSFQFLTGMVPQVLSAMRQQYYVQINDQRFSVTPPQLNRYSAPLRAYQHEVLSAAFSNVLNCCAVGGYNGLWWPRGILRVATGGGKTEIAVAMYQSYPVTTWFLVHRKDLLFQAKERFEKYGITPGIIGANQFKPNPRLNIVTIQTLVSRIKNNDKWVQSQIGKVEQVFFDEAHIMASSQDKGNQFVGIGNKFTNAHARWGLTATPFMRSKYDNLLLEGVTGSILADVSTDYLIKQGFLTPPKVKMIKVPGKLPMTVNYKRSNKAKAEYYRKVAEKGIVSNSWRNKRIADEALNGPHPVLILVKTIAQGNQIKAIYDAKPFGSDIPFITGQHSAQIRQAAAGRLNDGTLRALIATTIFDEGIDIPGVKKVILASGGKSQVKLLQRIGRGVRLAAGKHEVEIIDFGDQHHKMLRRHALERINVFKQEGFEVETE